MRKRTFKTIFALAMLLAVSLPALAATAALNIEPGSYAVTPMTEWDRIKNDDRYYSDLPTLPGKPASLQVALTEQESAVAIYSVMKLGNAGDLIHLAYGGVNDKVVDFLYVDANNDLNLTADEKMEIKKNSPRTYGDAEILYCEAIKPVVCTVNYRRADGTILARPISIKFSFTHIIPPSKMKLEPFQFSSYLINTWFTGNAGFKLSGDGKNTAFALIDGDDNGVFNDFGRDVLLVDANGDGSFDLEKEIYPLTEFDEVKVTSKTVAQRRRILFAWPTVMLVQGSKESIDPLVVEPE